MTELQQSKYQDLQAGLPSELSMQLTEVALALEYIYIYHKMLIYSCTSHFFVLIPLSFDHLPLFFAPHSYSPVIQALCEECESCSRSLAELGVSVQEFGEQNPLLCKQLGDAVAKLTEMQRHTVQQVQDRQAERQMEEYQSMKAFILGWMEKAEGLVTGSIAWSSASQLQEQIRAHQLIVFKVIL
uniref:Uncharacterized protein n=1 Tax=Mola mola TaxID=94237 RepID=A0A3Q3X3H4_MOLML